jgi:hypothetical protein
MTGELDIHLATLVSQLKQGAVIPFLGAGANLANRAPGATYRAHEGLMLPTGAELAQHLASDYESAIPDPQDLVRVAEWIALSAGEGALYRALREVFDVDYPSTPLHELLASVSPVLRQKGWLPLQLLVTTNYDDLLERAFRAVGEPFDVLTYMAVGKEEGRFLHFPPEGEPRLIDDANAYLLPQDDRGNLLRPAILKLHGAVDRIDQERDSYVITEDDYIDYIARTDIQGLIPPTLLKKLRHSNFLFLGYSLRDWNVRAILYRIWALQKVDFKSWAIQHDPDDLDQLAWKNRGVHILAEPLDAYIKALGVKLEQIPPRTTVHA